MKKNDKVIQTTDFEFQSILDFLTQLQSDNFGRSLPSASDPQLNLLVIQINMLSTLLEKKAKALEHRSNMSKNTEKIGKIGGWELNVATNDLLWSEETFNILEVDRNGSSTPNLPVGLTLFTEKSVPIITEALKNAIEQGLSYNLELEALTAKGNVVWVQTNGEAKRVDGKIVSVSGTIQDIAKRKQAEITSKFASVSLGFGTWIFDLKSKALEWDDQMYLLYDVRPLEFEGAYLAWENKLSPADKDKTVKDLELAIKGEKEFNSEFAIVLRDGTERYIAGKGTVFYDQDGTPAKMIGLNWDVTARINKELELKNFNLKLIHSSKLASLGEMSAGIAHEINNPLSIILGTVGSLSKCIENKGKFDSKITTIQKSCNRIDRIVSGLKKISRSGDKINRRALSLCSIVEESMILTQAKASQNDVVISLDCSIEAFVFCDEVEIEQVIINLINNAVDAVKFKEEKWVKILIFENESSVFLQIIDAGNGIPKDIRDQLFNPFFTTKVIGEGTGIGLSIVKGILNNHNATIDILENSANTCFELKFQKIQDQAMVG